MASGVQGGTNVPTIVPTTNLDTPISNFLSVKEKHADQPSKKTCDTIPHPNAASVEPPWLEKKKLIFENICLGKGVVCNVTDRILCLKC